MPIQDIERLAVALLASVALLVSSAGVAAEHPAKNPFLADSVYPLGHGDAAQQDALPVPGPSNPGATLGADEIQYAATGPGQFGAYTSSPYPDGRRVLWSNGIDRIVKVDFDSFEILATHWLPEAKRWTEAEADDAIETFDGSNEGIFARDNQWTLEAIEWEDGRSAFHSVIGGQRYNPFFSGTEIDELGRIHYGTPWGRVRLNPAASGE